MKISKVFRFEASHILSRHPGKCSRLHGHSWVLRVSVEGPVDPAAGFVIDFGDISKIVNERVIDKLDHRHLGTWEHMFTLEELLYHEHPLSHGWAPPEYPSDLYPTCENLLMWIGQRLLPDLVWSELELEETSTSRATLTREEFDAAIKAKEKK